MFVRILDAKAVELFDLASKALNVTLAQPVVVEIEVINVTDRRLNCRQQHTTRNDSLCNWLRGGNSFGHQRGDSCMPKLVIAFVVTIDSREAGPILGLVLVKEKPHLITSAMDLLDAHNAMPIKNSRVQIRYFSGPRMRRKVK